MFRIGSQVLLVSAGELSVLACMAEGMFLVSAVLVLVTLVFAGWCCLKSGLTSP